MERNFTYHPNEVVLSTIDDIVDFFLKDPRSDRMKFSGKALKNLLKHKEDPKSEGYYIGSQSLSLTNGEIFGDAYTGDESHLRKYIVETIPIIFAKFDGKEFVLMDIIIYPGRTDHPEDFHASFKKSAYAAQIMKQFRQSEDAVERYKM